MATNKSKKTTTRGTATRSATTRRAGDQNSTTSNVQSEEESGTMNQTKASSSNQASKTGSRSQQTASAKNASRTKSAGVKASGSRSGNTKNTSAGKRSGQAGLRTTRDDNRSRNQSAWQDEGDGGYRRSMYQEDDYRRSSGSNDRYRDEYYRDRELRSNYGTDRYGGRNQERYGAYEPRERYGSRYADQENYRYSGGGSGRAPYGDNRGNRGNQEYYYADEWRGERGLQRRPDVQQMETYGHDRQAAGYGRYRNARPSGKDDEGLRKLFTDQLKDMYWAEKALTKAIPKMIKKATGRELIQALNQHLYETEDQVQKLESVFRLLGQKPAAKKCEAMEGLIKEADEIIKEMDAGSVRDAGIICAGQKVEHYEIATYGCLSTYAEILGETEMVDILEEILEEEKQADKTLTRVATRINWEATMEEDENDEEEEEDDEDDEEEEEEEDDEDDEEEEEDSQIQGAMKSSKF